MLICSGIDPATLRPDSSKTSSLQSTGSRVSCSTTSSGAGSSLGGAGNSLGGAGSSHGGAVNSSAKPLINAENNAGGSGAGVSKSVSFQVPFF